MASTYSNYKIELITTGEQAGTWGDTTNNNWGSTTTTYRGIEQAIGGYSAITITTAPKTLDYSSTTGNSYQEFRSLYLYCSGTVSPFTPSTATPSLVVPAIQKTYIIKNDVLATLSGTYTRSANTVTVTTASAHGLSNGNVVTLAFSAGTGGTATSGTYSVTSTGLTTFTITDPVGGTITGSGTVTVGYPLTVKIGTSTGTAVPYGRVMVLYANGTDVVTTSDYFSSILTVGSGNFGSSGSFGGSLSVGGNTTLSGNLAVGSTSNGVTYTNYSKTTTTITVNGTGFPFANADIVYVELSGGDAPSGLYTVSSPSSTQFVGTPVFGSFPTGTTGGTVTNITRYNNTATIQTPLSSFGSVGTSGYVLTSQGANVPPKWSDPGTFSGNITVAGTATFNGNTTVGSTTVNSGSSTMTTSVGVSFTITGSGVNVYSLAAADVVYIVTAGGSVPTGFYTIASVTGTSPNVTAFTCNYSSATASAGTVTSVTKYNNTATLQAPLSSFGSVGTSGYLLASQGTGAPPQWISGVSQLYNTEQKLAVDSNGGFIVKTPTAVSFTGATSGISTTLTASSVTGNIEIGQSVSGLNITPGTTITAFGTGTGGAGTYIMSAASTGTVSGTVTASPTPPSNYYPAFFTRAWANFNPGSYTTVTGTYTWGNSSTPTASGTVVTITYANHGFVTNDVVYLNFTAGTGNPTAYKIFYSVTRVSDSVFTVTGPASVLQAAPAAVSWYLVTPNAGGNIRRISVGTPGAVIGIVYGYSLMFQTPLPDANYAWSGSTAQNAAAQANWLASPYSVAQSIWKKAGSLYVVAYFDYNSFASNTPDDVSVIINR